MDEKIPEEEEIEDRLASTWWVGMMWNQEKNAMYHVAIKKKND